MIHAAHCHAHNLERVPAEKIGSSCTLACTQLRKGTSSENLWFLVPYVNDSIYIVLKKKSKQDGAISSQ